MSLLQESKLFIIFITTLLIDWLFLVSVTFFHDFRDRSKDLEEKLDSWLSDEKDWTRALQRIILGDDFVHRLLPEESKVPGYYLSQDVPTYNKCGKDIRWCTINEIEKNKCKWVATEASVLGISPKISCEQASSTFECFRNIKESKTDIMTIDSNYGYLVRK